MATKLQAAEPVRWHAASLAGVWGEASPQVPPEARPNVGPAARVRETSQPGAEGAEGARRGKGLSENKVFISGDMGEDDVVPLAVELIPLEVD